MAIKPMLAWCYYCERRLVWSRMAREWRPQTPVIRNVGGVPTRMANQWCPLSPTGFDHVPVPTENDVQRLEKV